MSSSTFTLDCNFEPIPNNVAAAARLVENYFKTQTLGHWDYMGIQSRRYPEPAKPSLLCRAIGHKWFVTNIEQRMEGEFLREHKEHIDMKHCTRCGQPNPNYEA